MTCPPGPSARLSVVIPALNEERGIGRVLQQIPPWINEVVVADNGSTDRTAEVAASYGARVVYEPQRGYGKACLTALAALDKPDVIVFLDGDASDDPTVMAELVQPITCDQADFVLGSRTLGRAEPGSLTLPQRFGNALACTLMRWLYGVRYTDLGPFRAIRASALQRLAMDDENYGWTIQMQIRAARHHLRIDEVPVPYARRIGRSKVSGTVRGVIGAGTKILYTLFKELGYRPDPSSALSPSSVPPADAGPLLIVFTRYPRPGRTKTRLIEPLGADGAADLHRQITHRILQRVRRLDRCDVQVHFDDADPTDMAELFGDDLVYIRQIEGDVGQRMAGALDAALSQDFSPVILIGTDVPGLTGAIIEHAFDLLATHDVVLGPAGDGGYYLIGMKRFHPALFEQIDWGTDVVARQTIDKARSLGLSVAMVDELIDIDRPDDLGEWQRHRDIEP